MCDANPLINSKEYWDNRFEEGSWEAFDGNQQSTFFSELAYQLFPDFLKADLQKNVWTVLDVGCAEGDGTAYLANKFPNSKFVGMDFSDIAIEKARQKFSACEYVVGDIYQDVPRVDVIFSSNVLEHLTNVRFVFDKLCKASDKYTVFLLPYEDDSAIEEHINRFEGGFFPLSVGESYLQYFRVVDCALLNSPFWNQKQILLVYTNSAFHANTMTIQDICGSCFDELTRMKEAFAAEKDNWQNASNQKDDEIETLKSLLVKEKDHCQAYQKQKEKDLIQLQRMVKQYQQFQEQQQTELLGLQTALLNEKRQKEEIQAEMQELRLSTSRVVEDALHSKPYQWAYFMQRTVRQGLCASSQERKNYLHWLRETFIYGKHEQDARYNPLIKIQQLMSVPSDKAEIQPFVNTDCD